MGGIHPTGEPRTIIRGAKDILTYRKQALREHPGIDEDALNGVLEYFAHRCFSKITGDDIPHDPHRIPEIFDNPQGTGVVYRIPFGTKPAQATVHLGDRTYRLPTHRIFAAGVRGRQPGRPVFLFGFGTERSDPSVQGLHCAVEATRNGPEYFFQKDVEFALRIAERMNLVCRAGMMIDDLVKEGRDATQYLRKRQD